jgi:type II secretory pathway pseudopilin PulG
MNMKRAWRSRAVVVLTVIAGALTYAASVAAQTPLSTAEQIKARQRISTMEGALERAVSNGAENLLRQVRTLMPDAPMLSGVPAVRGFRLDGYGVFFDVEVPALRLPVTWPLRYLIDDNRAAVSTTLAEMRALVAERERDRFELLAQRLELRAVTPQVKPRAADPMVTEPDEAYTKAVRETLIDAMIENSGPIGIGADEWLTIAARDNAPRDPLLPGDTAGLNTLLFRVKGSDLAAFRAGRLTLDDARHRVEVREN